jgi:DNA-directed RNA polymerase subunit L
MSGCGGLPDRNVFKALFTAMAGMELVVLEQGKNRLKFELKGEDHSFCNILKKELWQDKHVDISGYYVEHSLVSAPVFTVQAKSGDPKKIVLDAVERLKKWNKDLKDQFKSL